MREAAEKQGVFDSGGSERYRDSIDLTVEYYFTLILFYCCRYYFLGIYTKSFIPQDSGSLRQNNCKEV